MALSYSPAGEALTKGFEQLRLMPYLDRSGPRAVWTVGWGHTGADVIPGQPWNAARAEQAFRADTAEAVAAVSRLVCIHLTQNQFDALVDFTFNVGVEAFALSTLLKLLNSGDYAGAAAQMLLWNKMHIAGVISASAGLTKRRAAENELFLTAPAVAT